MAHETLVVARLRSNTGIPADTVEMGFAFSNDSDNGGTSTDSGATNVRRFLTDTFGPGTLSSMLAGSLNHSASDVQVDTYNISTILGGGHRGSPIATNHLTLDTPSVSTDLPLQAAIGLSYHGTLTGVPEFGSVDPAIPTDEHAIDEGAPATHSGTTRMRSRRRGRILFGPLNEAAMESDALRIREPDPSFITIAVGAMEFLAAADVGWSVWSRRDAALHRISGGWVAHETDVVRRRRLKATVRTLWP